MIILKYDIIFNYTASKVVHGRSIIMSVVVCCRIGKSCLMPLGKSCLMPKYV